MPPASFNVDDTGNITSTGTLPVTAASKAAAAMPAAVLATANAESPDRLIITNGQGRITTAAMETWTLVSPDANTGPQLMVGQSLQKETWRVVQAQYDKTSKRIVQKNIDGNFYSKVVSTDANWTEHGATDPLAVVPIPAPTVPASPAAGSVSSDATSTLTTMRVSSVLSAMAFNAYANGQDSHVGMDTAGYIAGIKSIVGNSGLAMKGRLYCDNTANQFAFAKTISAAVPGFKWTVCITDLSSVGNTITLAKQLANAGILFAAEGMNEPDQLLGRPATAAADCLKVQQQLFAALDPLGIKVAAPSVSKYNQNDYFGSTLEAIKAASHYGNGHIYPNHGGPNGDFYGDTQMNLTASGVGKLLGKSTTILSEFQPNLYNDNKDANFGANITLWSLLSAAFDQGVPMLAWWSAFGYPGFAVDTTLFGSPSAKALANLFALTGDTGATRDSFTPGKLNITAKGLPAGPRAFTGGRLAVMQNSSGAFFPVLWNEQDSMSAAKPPVTLTFGERTPNLVKEFDLITGKQTGSWANTRTISTVLPVGAKVYQVA